MTRRIKRTPRLGDKVLIPRLGGPNKLIDVQGMTVEDWERVYFAHLAFTTQVRCIVAEVEARKPSHAITDKDDALRAALSLLKGEKEFPEDETIWGQNGKNLVRISSVIEQIERALNVETA